MKGSFRSLLSCDCCVGSPRDGTSAIQQGEQEKQRLSPPPPPPPVPSLWNSPIVQRYPAASPHLPQEAANANALENQNLQASPAFPSN
ncbi:hypothetical protein HID58_006927 [Brassica napus]|uniref:Uncharacterized protein n=1 Tax=Brassica napus TaxID=3708 RepID=A0ABQ8ECR7_BRANA|nr:hypothetical protein HID58_006927 [Brassica napus]